MCRSENSLGALVDDSVGVDVGVGVGAYVYDAYCVGVSVWLLSSLAVGVGGSASDRTRR